jgi:hypothetical protein
VYGPCDLDPTADDGLPRAGSSILSRLGSSTAKNAPSQGTKILVKNLKYDILEDDVRELFGTVGKVSKAEIVYDRSGRSKGIARVWFDRRADAEKAIKQYDGTWVVSQLTLATAHLQLTFHATRLAAGAGRTLDGQAMQITLDAESNVRQGLFGTALRDDKDVKFKVSFGYVLHGKRACDGAVVVVADPRGVLCALILRSCSSDNKESKGQGRNGGGGRNPRRPAGGRG